MKITKMTVGNLKGSQELLQRVQGAMLLTGQDRAAMEISRVCSILSAVECDVVLLQRAAIRSGRRRNKI